MSHFHADDGEKIHVKISGDGPPLVLLHGWTSSHHEWFPFLDDLTSGHRVYRWDARGHGNHPPGPGEAPTAPRMARDLLNLLDHYELERVAAVGHSMGALILWQFIRDYGSDRLRHVCFIDQSPRLVTDDEWRHGIYCDFDANRSRAFLNDLDNDFAESVLRLTAFGLNQRAREKYLANAGGWESATSMAAPTVCRRPARLPQGGWALAFSLDPAFCRKNGSAATCSVGVKLQRQTPRRGSLRGVYWGAWR